MSCVTQMQERMLQEHLVRPSQQPTGACSCCHQQQHHHPCCCRHPVAAQVAAEAHGDGVRLPPGMRYAGMAQLALPEQGTDTFEAWKAAIETLLQARLAADYVVY